jgi:hypothetical protein
VPVTGFVVPLTHGPNIVVCTWTAVVETPGPIAVNVGQPRSVQDAARLVKAR